METIFHILADRLEVLVVNAGHVKAVPGRKTDVADSEWLADLLQHGLLRASFIPDRDQRDLRDLTRTRTSLIDERSRTVRRLQKVLEDANVKLSSVATDIMGVSGRRSWP
ncbi:MAG: transposase, partial [Chloroflexi bacterium]|nr:transposase [Chloroflexota bacterium]